MEEVVDKESRINEFSDVITDQNIIRLIVFDLEGFSLSHILPRFRSAYLLIAKLEYFLSCVLFQF